jgi:stringent starvation protein B
MHDWITDNGQTSHIVVDAAQDGVQVPTQFVRDGKIVLNISPSAVSGMRIDNDALTFQARFSGAVYAISVPINAVLGIYARETGRGMIFSDETAVAGSDEPPPGPDGPDGSGPPAPPGGGKPRERRLKVVK